MIAKYFLTFSLLFGSAAYANPYKGLIISSVDTELVYDRLLTVGDIEIPTTISYESNSSDLIKNKYTISYIKQNFAISHLETLKFLRERGHEAEVCRRPYSLHIFILSQNTMYNSGLFDNWIAENNASGVLAFYDSTPEIRGESNIILSHLGDKLNYEAMQHEFAHYWYNKYCLSSMYSNTEDFALEMEYRSRRYYHEYFSN